MNIKLSKCNAWTSNAAIQKKPVLEENVRNMYVKNKVKDNEIIRYKVKDNGKICVCHIYFLI